MSSLPSHQTGPTPSSTADENEVATLDSEDEAMNEDDSSKQPREKKLKSKANSPKLPILSKMTHDILAIPTTTVASESAFSVGGRVIDETRASLLPDVVEALITTGDWLPLKKKRKVLEDDLANSSKIVKLG